MTEDSHNLSWEDDEEAMTFLAMENAIMSRRQDRRTIGSTAIALFHAITPSTAAIVHYDDIRSIQRHYYVL